MTFFTVHMGIRCIDAAGHLPNPTMEHYNGDIYVILQC